MDSITFAQSKKEEFIARRRDLHQHPEPAWLEYRTAAMAADFLEKLGYELAVGAEVIAKDARMGLPSEAEMQAWMNQALAEGANPKWVEAIGHGFTGIVATMRFAEAGPVVAFRADMDANDVIESTDEAHLPVKLGFASKHAKAMHACGHDTHVTMALGIAEYIATHKDEFKGTFKLILQPAEEGVRGGRAMAEAGVVDDVDVFFGMHIGIDKNLANKFTCMNPGFLATTKLDAKFTGYSSHAGATPQLGKNALLAACTAALNLQGISRHSEGASRINVGVLEAGTGRNVIPDNALLKIETRGSTTAINDYVRERAYQILNGAAAMHDVQVEITEMGSAPASVNSEDLAREIKEIAEGLGIFSDVLLEYAGGGSEDCAYFLERVIQKGGRATYTVLGSAISAPHHNPKFDIIEEDMINGVAAMSAIVSHYLKK